MRLSDSVNKSKLIYIVTGGALIGLLTGLWYSMPLIVILIFGTIGALGIAYWCFTQPRGVLYFLLVFMPFETIVIKYIPGPNEIYVISNFLSESLIYLSVGFILARSIWKKRSLRKTPIDILFLVFLLTAILSMWVNQSPFFGGFVNIRNIIRYLFLFYLVSNLDFSPTQVSRLLYLIVVLGVIEIAIGLLQIGVGEPLNQILLPRRMKFNIEGISRQFILVTRGREIGAIYGTLGDPLFFALFMLIVLAVYLGLIERFKVKQLVVIGLVCLAVALAYARAVVFVILIMFLLYYHLRYGLSRLPKWIYPLLLLPVLLIIVIASVANNDTGYINPAKDRISILQNLSDIFTKDYFVIAQRQRLGALLGIPPTVLVNRPLLGYGPDQVTTIKKLNASSPSYLHKTLNRRGFEDVYWTVILAYYGIIGVTVWVLMFYSLYRYAKRIYLTSDEKVTKGLAVTVISLVVATIVLMFFYRVLEFRVYSFYFWFLAGLMVGMDSRERVST